MYCIISFTWKTFIYVIRISQDSVVSDFRYEFEKTVK